MNQNTAGNKRRARATHACCIALLITIAAVGFAHAASAEGSHVTIIHGPTEHPKGDVTVIDVPQQGGQHDTPDPRPADDPDHSRPDSPHREHEPAPAQDALTPEEMAQSILSAGPWTPRVRIAFETDGPMDLGAMITLEALVDNSPDGYAAQYQWKNDATGQFEDVPGATERTYAYHLDAYNLRYSWLVDITFVPLEQGGGL